jgi:hypothetical protein
MTGCSTVADRRRTSVAHHSTENKVGFSAFFCLFAPFSPLFCKSGLSALATARPVAARRYAPPGTAVAHSARVRLARPTAPIRRTRQSHAGRAHGRPWKPGSSARRASGPWSLARHSPYRSSCSGQRDIRWAAGGAPPSVITRKGSEGSRGCLVMTQATSVPRLQRLVKCGLVGRKMSMATAPEHQVAPGQLAPWPDRFTPSLEARVGPVELRNGLPTVRLRTDRT